MIYLNGNNAMLKFIGQEENNGYTIFNYESPYYRVVKRMKNGELNSLSIRVLDYEEHERGGILLPKIMPCHTDEGEIVGVSINTTAYGFQDKECIQFMVLGYQLAIIHATEIELLITS